MIKDSIIIKGAREHNLKNIDLEIPRQKLVVVTGLSGSGKSSLAFDTIYAEGQRRYVESLSSYARQFLEQLQKPDVDYIEGLSPAISIEQRTAGSNPRSTVGTQTEIYDYLRLLYARIGVPHCPKCKKPITRQTSQEIVDQILKLPENSKILILAGLIRGRKGEYKDLFQKSKKDGFVRVRVDDKVMELEDKISLDKKKAHTIEIVVDRLILKGEIRKRLTDSVETALEVGKGLVVVNVESKDNVKKDILFSELYACIDCGISLGEIEPRIFSFNSPYGACPMCDGLGIAFRMGDDFSGRMFFLCLYNIFFLHPYVSGTETFPQYNLFFRHLALDITAEVLVGNEYYLLFFQRPDNLHRITRSAGNIAFRLYLGACIDVADDRGSGVLFSFCP